MNRPTTMTSREDKDCVFHSAAEVFHYYSACKGPLTCRFCNPPTMEELFRQFMVESDLRIRKLVANIVRQQ